MNWAAIVWLGLLVIFLIVEAVCAVHLVSIWFAAGALCALFAALWGGQIWLQVSLFFLVSTVLLALLWPLVRKFLNPSHTATNVDAVIGSVGMVTEEINNLTATGQVKLGGMEWSARSTTGEIIPEGALVRVERVEGVKLFVTPVETRAKIEV